MPQKTNDQIILEQILAEKATESDGEISTQDYFEIYSAAEILKDHDLSYDDIKYGIVGNGGDGGIDSIYTFLNGEHLKEDTAINTNQKQNRIQVNILQSKTTNSFNEDAIIKFRESAQDLFNLSNDLTEFSARYNPDLIEQAVLFRDTYTKLVSTFPEIEVRYFYATLGQDIHPNVTGKVQKLQGDILNMFSGARFSFNFMGAPDLLELARKTPATSRVLTVAESPIGTDSGSYLCLVTLTKYYEFISDSESLSKSIFDSNVRDYQGNIAVNKGIQETLKNSDSEDFWYLNNGVTIITPKAILGGKQLTIEDPQIVNGLQTSHELYTHFLDTRSSEPDDRCILVRVISEENEDARDRIIRATNSQTSIPPASLRSSDQVHRNIEDYLKGHGFHYDRKKNFYKNQGVAISKIVSIPFMAQALMAIVLCKPDSARARPSTLINSDAEYSRLFNLEIPIEVYLRVIQIMKSVEVFLKPERCGKTLERKTVTNVKYYVALLATIKLAGSKQKIISYLKSLGDAGIEDSILQAALEEVLIQFKELGGTDRVAKGPELVATLLKSNTNETQKSSAFTDLFSYDFRKRTPRMDNQ